MEWWIVVLVVILVLLVAAGFFVMSRSRGSKSGRHLKEQFGDEYDREVQQAPSREAGEQRLQERLERHDRLDIVELSADQRQAYLDQWRDVQGRFVNEPEATLGEADRLISQAMRDRGYPTERLEQKIEDLSVEHAGTLDAYREAHAIADRHEQQGVSTEELRLAMQRFRTVFEDVVGARTAGSGHPGSDGT